jgi:proline iminopeptidase
MNENNTPSPFFPELTPFATHRLPVTDGHTLYIEQSGNPSGIPVLILHGGPGSGLSDKSNRRFDPALYHMIAFDQRGAGRSTPTGSLAANTTQHLIADIEAIRTFLNIESAVVYGTSWGSTLALAYAQTHPQQVRGLIIGGIFLGTSEELDWFATPFGAAQFAWPQYQQLAECVGGQNPVDTFAARTVAAIMGPEPLATQTAQAWSMFEGMLMELEPDAHAMAEYIAAEADLRTSAAIEMHYFANQCFLKPNQLLDEAHSIAHIPTYILQGGLDLVCPPAQAYRLHAALPSSVLTIVQLCGHRANDAMEAARIEATGAMAKRLTA